MKNVINFFFYAGYIFGKKKVQTYGSLAAYTNVLFLHFVAFINVIGILKDFEIINLFDFFYINGVNEKNNQKISVFIEATIIFLIIYPYYRRNGKRILLLYHRKYKGKNWKLFFNAMSVLLLYIVFSVIISNLIHWVK